MKSERFEEKGITVFKAVVISVILAAVVVGSTMCAPSPQEAKEGATLAIEHFSVIEGTTRLEPMTAQESESPKSIPM
jgi:hypothetical protein